MALNAGTDTRSLGGLCSLNHNPNPGDQSHGAYPSNMRASGSEDLTLLNRRDKLKAVRLISSRHGLVMMTTAPYAASKPVLDLFC